MKTTDEGKKFIKRWAGLRLVPYNNALGRPCIGFAHIIKPGEYFGKGITVEQANRIFDTDIAVVDWALNRYINFPDHLTENQYTAVASFVFSVGVNPFKSSTLLKYLNLKWMLPAAQELLRYVVGVLPGGKRVKIQELIDKRRAERELFLKKD